MNLYPSRPNGISEPPPPSYDEFIQNPDKYPIKSSLTTPQPGRQMIPRETNQPLPSSFTPTADYHRERHIHPVDEADCCGYLCAADCCDCFCNLILTIPAFIVGTVFGFIYGLISGVAIGLYTAGTMVDRSCECFAPCPLLCCLCCPCITCGTVATMIVVFFGRAIAYTLEGLFMGGCVFCRSIWQDEPIIVSRLPRNYDCDIDVLNTGLGDCFNWDD